MFTEKQQNLLEAKQNLRRRQEMTKRIVQKFTELEDTAQVIADSSRDGDAINVETVFDHLSGYLPAQWEQAIDETSERTAKEQVAGLFVRVLKSTGNKYASLLLKQQGIPSSEQTRDVVSVFRQDAIEQLDIPTKVARQDVSQQANHIANIMRAFAARRGLKVE